MTEPMNWAAYFDERMEGELHRYVRDRWLYNAPIFREIQRLLPAGGKILEFGSGSGTYAAMLAHFGYEIVGVELSEEMVEMARKMAGRLGSKSIRFEQGTILDLSAHYGRHDLAYSCGVIEHFYDADAVRVLREAGRCAPQVFVLVPSYWSWRNTVATTQGIFECYTLRRLRRVVREAGLEIVEEIGFSAGSKVGRAIELLVPPIVQPRLFKHFAATIGVVARAADFVPTGEGAPA